MRLLVRLGAAVLLGWTAGFVAFAVTLPRPAAPDRVTDAIVVLTGAAGRVERGADLLAHGRAQRLLISGADRRVRLRDIADAYHLPAELLPRIDLGHAAVDTRSNAAETARWIDRHDYRSVRLVTTDWHMPRALFEFRRLTRGRVLILPDGVRSEPGLLTLANEYDKYLLRRLMALVRPAA